MQRALIIGGAILIAVGILWPVLRRIGLGRLPGDLTIHRPGFDLHLPITTCIILSIVLSVLLWLLRR